ncbi:aromatic ring-hydroxylating dioxygenase subunit alpha [uncultured Tateyamaria sp.]|uniref:aromatic ring-hydroxylating oxygenase subunit alpha n=1 Tax=uncultured Tateyamaria sp. TaxID=455651 RepID=UPI00260FEA15|nr:aromatic ring-hydroxylating dioxygenase subunit alpha [uncultured Tateyamaria sp.]
MDTHADEVAVDAGVHKSLPAHLYTDDAVFEREMAAIFATSWQLARHQSQVAEKGDFIAVDVAGERIALRRGDDGELRAFYNFCIHRGHTLLEGSGNRGTVVCPYHAWCYDTHGRLKSVPNAKHIPKFQVDDDGLRRVSLEVFQGLIFVNLDPDAAPLAAGLVAMADEIRDYLPNLPSCHFAHRTKALLKANWKIVIENFSECYHCHIVHKTFTEGVIKPEAYRIMARGDSHLHCALSQSGDTNDTAADQAAKTDIFAAWYLWPLTAVQVYPGGVGMTFRWIPLVPEWTKVEVDWWLTAPTPKPSEQALIDQHEATTFAEDIPLVESVQRNQHSRGFANGLIMVDAPRGNMSEHGV